MRCIIVGTAYIQSTRWRSMSASGALRVEARHHHEVVALEQREGRARERAVVIERAGDEVHAVR